MCACAAKYRVLMRAQKPNFYTAHRVVSEQNVHLRARLHRAGRGCMHRRLRRTRNAAVHVFMGTSLRVVLQKNIIPNQFYSRSGGLLMIE